MTRKLKNELRLLKEPLLVIIKDEVNRGIVEFESTDSHKFKIVYASRLLVYAKEVIPLPAEQITLPNMTHRLARWISHNIPADHALLN